MAYIRDDPLAETAQLMSITGAPNKCKIESFEAKFPPNLSCKISSKTHKNPYDRSNKFELLNSVEINTRVQDRCNL